MAAVRCTQYSRKRERLGGRGLWRCGGAAGDAPAYSPSDPRAAPLVRPASREEPTKLTTPTRRTLPRTALATTVLAAPSVAYAAGNDARSGRTDRYDDHSLRFEFKGPFPDFLRLLRTANVGGAGRVAPAKYYQEVGQEELRVESQAAQLNTSRAAGWPRGESGIGATPTG